MNMSMKLLPALVDPVDPSHVPDVSNSLAPLAQRAITTSTGHSVVPSADAFTGSSSTGSSSTGSSSTWSSRARRSGVIWIDATPVEDSLSGESGLSAVEYVSGWAWSSPIERAAIAHYLFYAAGLANGIGRLIDLYA
jgi:hypothetical protein